MVDFLLQDGVTESLMAFITQVGINVPRPGPTDDASQSHSMKLSYKAVLLLTANEPTEALMTYLSKRAFIISKCIFDVSILSCYENPPPSSFFLFKMTPPP